jgi:hypothetical protein
MGIDWLPTSFCGRTPVNTKVWIIDQFLSLVGSGCARSNIYENREGEEHQIDEVWGVQQRT